MNERIHVMQQRLDWSNENEREMIMLIMYLLPFYQLATGEMEPPDDVEVEVPFDGGGRKGLFLNRDEA